MRRTLLGLVFFLGACGSSSVRSTNRGTAAPRVCPPAEAVRIGLWQYEEDGEARAAGGAAAAAHWQVVLAMVHEPSNEGEPRSPLLDEPLGPRDVDAIRDHVDGPLGDQAWIYTDAGAPCAAEVVGYYLAETDMGGKPYRVLAAQVEGCPTTNVRVFSIGWAVLGAADPAGCVAVDHAQESYRDVASDDVDQPWFPDGALPAQVAAAVPARSCDEPGCEAVWNVARVHTDELDVYDVMLTWLQIDTSADPCEWTAENHQAIYLSSAGGTLERTALEQLHVYFVLRDDGGARLLLTTRMGVYGVHELSADGLGAGRVVGWYLPHAEDGDWFSMAPYCGRGLRFYPAP